AMLAVPWLPAGPALASQLFYSAKSRVRVSPDAETAALIHLRAQKFEEAINVLDTTVERELQLAAPSLRLLDLLATLYARKGRLGKLATLAARVEAAAQGKRATAMLDRAGKWRDEQSKWRRDRANTETTIKWRRTIHEVEGSRKYARRDDIIIPA
ncbi:MAG TPA: hypothetical protein VMZ01_05980, partial [Aestuariivirga sp.]|nr:hypothetical protein [Aestuariivirga sp.]